MKKHKRHYIKYEMIGQPSDAYYFSHELVEHIGKMYNLPPRKNPFYKTEMMLERKTKQHSGHSGLKRFMQFGGKRMLHDGLIDLRFEKLKHRIRRRLV